VRLCISVEVRIMQAIVHYEQEFNGASFQLLDRRGLRWVYPEIVEAITGVECSGAAANG